MCKIAEIALEDIGAGRNRLALIRAKPADRAPWKRHQIECLPTIVNLARCGDLEFWTYRELWEEAHVGSTYPAASGLSLLENVSVGFLSFPLIRGDLFRSAKREGATAAVIRFCQFLLGADNAVALAYCRRTSDAGESQVEELLLLLKALCRHCEPPNFPDMLHVAAGHIHQIPHFLTADRKLANIIRNSRVPGLQCFPIFPEELLQLLNKPISEPLPWKYGMRYSLSGLQYDDENDAN
jgi:hypothetical protein